jgi:hypothetical protein
MWKRRPQIASNFSKSQSQTLGKPSMIKPLLLFISVAVSGLPQSRALSFAPGTYANVGTSSGDITLTEPGSYKFTTIATSITGNLVLAKPGTYNLEVNSVNSWSGSIIGPSAGAILKITGSFTTNSGGMENVTFSGAGDVTGGPGNLSFAPGKYGKITTGSGHVTFTEPGLYEVSSITTFSGKLSLSSPGTYRVDTPSIITSSGNIEGPPDGALLRFSGSFTSSSGSLVNVTLGDFPEEPTQNPMTVVRDASSPISNISTRVSINAGQSLVAGFVVDGTTDRVMLIRAVGPTLGTFGISGALPNPQITIAGAGINVSNDDWQASISNYFDVVGAFSLPAGSLDARGGAKITANGRFEKHRNIM